MFKRVIKKAPKEKVESLNASQKNEILKHFAAGNNPRKIRHLVFKSFAPGKEFGHLVFEFCAKLQEYESKILELVKEVDSITQLKKELQIDESNAFAAKIVDAVIAVNDSFDALKSALIEDC